MQGGGHIINVSSESSLIKMPMLWLYAGTKTALEYMSDMWGNELAAQDVREAVGVVAAITPWNVPLYVNVGKVAAALLAGCTVILKPAPNTPGMGAIFGEFAAQLDFPPGVLNVITSEDPATAGEMLVADPRVDLISFTGSTGVGKRIMEKGAATLKRIFLELRGKSAKIVLEDAPNFQMEIASSMLVFHAGQGCAVQSRLFVHKSRYAEAVVILKGSYAAFSAKWGVFDDPAHIMGPVVSQRQKERVMSYIALGQKEGATLIAGGSARPDKGGGYFIEPTCFADVTNDMRIAQEEIFGPVLVVIPFEDDEDAIRIANDSAYGLGGGVASADLDRAMKIARRVRAGTMSVNGGMSIAGDIPFGGYKASGMGREWRVEGIEEFLETKLIAVRL
jgi:aldehyde dehydrogenase (NAD+)